MTETNSFVWKNSTLSSDKNIVFVSKPDVSECCSLKLDKATLILVMEDASLLHSDVKISFFLNSMENPIYLQQSVTITACHNKEPHVFTVPFSLTQELKNIQWPSSDCAQVLAMVTFPSGKPNSIVGSHLIVTGSYTCVSSSS